MSDKDYHRTPDLSHLKSSHYELVYEPSEDTFLFLDALSDSIEEQFLQTLKPKLCVELGYDGHFYFIS
jgi:methylase of polypeptide subunit release factors